MAELGLSAPADERGLSATFYQSTGPRIPASGQHHSLSKNLEAYCMKAANSAGDSPRSDRKEHGPAMLYSVFR